MSKVGVIGDTHLPAVRKGYLQFCMDTFAKFKCDKFVHIGDVVDMHAVSFHQPHPDAPGPLDEIKQTRESVKLWYKAFPDLKICIGNHDARFIRLAATVKIPDIILRSYNEIWETPKWTWRYDYIIDGIYYTHGDGAGGGLYPAYNMMRKIAMPVVMGHHHSACGVKFLVNPERRLFGCDVGSGVDDKAVNMLYMEKGKIRSVISCATVIDGIPQVHIMPMGKGERYNDKNFK
jgi:predicted phosphodiesterase